MASSGAGDGVPDADDSYMADAEIEAANSALKEIAQQRRLHNRVPPTFVRYDPSGDDSAALDPVTARRSTVGISPLPYDPLAPPKFRRRRAPRPSPPTPVKSTPPRPPSRNEWKIPPCLSRWMNTGGSTIPLDKRRRASDGEAVRVGNNFARLAEMLYAAELRAREAVLMRRREAQKEVRARLMERRERELRELAGCTRAKRPVPAAAPAARAADAAAPAKPPVSTVEKPGNDEKPKAKHSVSDISGDAEEQPKKVTKTDEGLSAGAPAKAAGKRERPAELDDQEQGDDPLELDQFMAQFASLGMAEFDLDELLGSMLHIK